jgi:hypothetical protein
MDLETVWYEFSPYLYALAGLLVIDQIGTLFGVCLGMALLAGSVLVLGLRWLHRRTESRNRDA